VCVCVCCLQSSHPHSVHRTTKVSASQKNNSKINWKLFGWLYEQCVLHCYSVFYICSFPLATFLWQVVRQLVRARQAEYAVAVSRSVAEKLQSAQAQIKVQDGGRDDDFECSHCSTSPAWSMCRLGAAFSSMAWLAHRNTRQMLHVCMAARVLLGAAML
jgi:hypothetical protein